MLDPGSPTDRQSAPGVANPLRRNIAIIAHVDHGKTTLVDAMLNQTGIFRANERVAERAMDTNDLERERGITILAKNTAVRYRDLIINICDTPGHADFGGEVERTLSMVDGVDAARRCLRRPAAADALRAPQGARTQAPADRRHQQDRSAGRARRRTCSTRSTISSSISTPPRISSTSRCSTPTRAPACATSDPAVDGVTLEPLFEAIVEAHSAAAGAPEQPLQMLIANLDSSDYLGRIAIGRIFNGRVRINDADCRRQARWLAAGDAGHEALRLRRPQARRHRTRLPRATSSVSPASTTSRSARPSPIRWTRCRSTPIAIDEPTVSMIFGVNTVAARRPRRQLRHLAQPARSARERAARQRVDPRRGHRLARAAQGGRRGANCSWRS